MKRVIGRPVRVTSFRVSETLRTLVRASTVGLAMFLGAGVCNGQSDVQIEQLPPPVVVHDSHRADAIGSGTVGSGTVGSAVPHFVPAPVDARSYPLWADYQPPHSKSMHRSSVHGAAACQCQQCSKKKSKPGNRLLGKLTHGLDIIIFGTCGEQCSCSSGCKSDCDSSGACFDGACDAIGSDASGLQHVPFQQHPHQHGQLPAAKSLPQMELRQLPVNRELPKQPSVPVRRNGSTPQQYQDPFVDDPITANGRSTIKPSGYKR